MKGNFVKKVLLKASPSFDNSQNIFLVLVNFYSKRARYFSNLDFHIIFHVINSSTQMKMLRKIIECESFKNSQENIQGGLYLSKIASLQCTDWTSTINRLHHRFFSESLPKASCLKTTFFKKSMM